jgi:hypothetical protein
MLITESFTTDRAIKYLAPLVMEFVIFICWRRQQRWRRWAGAHFLLFKRRAPRARGGVESKKLHLPTDMVL